MENWSPVPLAKRVHLYFSPARSKAVRIQAGAYDEKDRLRLRWQQISVRLVSLFAAASLTQRTPVLGDLFGGHSELVVGLLPATPPFVVFGLASKMIV